ncbi:MAG TPA: hypothetical protein VL860_14365 [Planctomycetota bacterium]|nr:hypothetical protein [Planctomycetota bacterium]
MAYLNLPMASDSLLFVAFGVALFYLKLNPAPVRRQDALQFAWYTFFTAVFLVFGFTIFRAWNTSEDMATQHVYRIVEVWAQGISWLVLGVGLLALYNALTPFTSRPEKFSDADDRHGRRGHTTGRDEHHVVGENESDYDARRREGRTPMNGSRVTSRRFGVDAAADLPDPELEAKVEDELASEPELVLSKDDEVLKAEPDFEPPKVKTESAATSGARTAAPERPKTERPKTEVRSRPRSEIMPAVKKSGANIPTTSDSRTAIPAVAGSGTSNFLPVDKSPGRATESVTTAPASPDAPVSVPVRGPASRSGSRPAAGGSGIRPAAKSGTVKSLPDKEPDTPSKDQYLDK